MRALATWCSGERSNSRRGRFRALLAPLASLVLVGALAAACSSNSSSDTTTSSSTTSTTSAARSTAAVSGMQMALASVGCYAGAVDGISGPATTQALRAFQAASGLTVDGVYGIQTKSKLLAAVSAGKRVCTTTTTSTTSTTSAGSGVPAAATAAITSYENANGPAAGTWMISSSQVSTVDPTYVIFHIGPTPGNQNTVQGGYGFAHSAGGTWSVIGFGSAEVGCPPGAPQNQVVPTAVLSGFGLTCPPS
jgi:peptidoglycan hydrolase-like protein with peptidoglycan-binding domain